MSMARGARARARAGGGNDARTGASREQSARALQSASGLRPAWPFVAIALVLLAVGGKAAHIALFSSGSQPDARERDVSLWPAFEISDRHGRGLAVPVECFDLSLSPRAMWRAHTPLRIAELLASVLDEDPEDLLARLLPADALDGEVVPGEPRILRLDRPRAESVARWLRTGRGADESAGEALPIRGVRLVELAEGGPWSLAWRPAELLAEEQRIVHLGERGRQHPELWVSELLGELERRVDLALLPPELAAVHATASEEDRHSIVREALWAELLPTQYRVVERWIQPSVAHEIADLLAEENVSPWQMQLEPALARSHPLRPEDEHSGIADAFTVLGHWGVLSPLDAQERARREAGLAPGDDFLNTRQRAFVLERTSELWNARHPLSGLELLAGTELEHERWIFLADRVASYERTLRSLPRDRRRAWSDGVPNYFVAAADASATPRVVSTLDAELQRFVHAELARLTTGIEPALAMAMVVELESGDVLAVDSVSRYPIGGFAPILHQFTPGSTFKAVVMALAHDLSLVDPAESFATYVPTGIVVRDASGRGRLIREAEGAPEEAWISAIQGIAESCNAVLVQIGLRIPPPVFRERLDELGYGRAPDIGIGPETAGYLAPLERGTWKQRFTHASVSFGHEIAVSAWQHAEALATILRGGMRRPLRLLAGVEQDGKRWDIEPETGRRVLSERAAAELRTMMAAAARTGTGMRVAGPDVCPEFYAPGAYVGTKTGTTEKVETELCLHVELAHNATEHPNGEPCPSACRAALRYRRDHKGLRNTCYTSSMVALGRLAGDEREVLVFVVVEDARCKLKFGADVAGPSAVAILRASHGLEARRAPEAVIAEADEPALLPAEWFNARDFPWAEEEGGE